MPVYEYRCSKCGKITEVFKPISRASDRFELCRFCTSMATRVFSKVGIVCRWGTGVVGGERQGYTPGVDNVQTEIRADMKALEEKAAHCDDPLRRHKLKESLKGFAEIHEDIL